MYYRKYSSPWQICRPTYLECLCQKVDHYTCQRKLLTTALVTIFETGPRHNVNSLFVKTSWIVYWLFCWWNKEIGIYHYSNVIMGAMASQISSLTIVYSSVYSAAGQRKHQSSASLAFARRFHRWPVNSPHKWPGTRNMFPFDDVIMIQYIINTRDE